MFEEFKKSSKQDWSSAAAADLKGEDAFKKYNWQNGSIEIAPYYDASDIENLSHLNAFRNRLALDDHTTGEARVWNNLQPIIVKNEKTANAEALFALINGADGIEFYCNQDQVDVITLLNDILPEYCYLSFYVNSKDDFDSIFNHFQKIDKKNVSINVSNNIAVELSQYLQLNVSNSRLVAVESSTVDSIEDEIAQLLLDCNKQIRLLLLRGIKIKEIVNSLTINTSIGTDFFTEIAKIRAIRNLIYQLIRAYGLDSAMPEDVFIRCISKAWTEEKYNPHANMLKGSTAALAAILGGCDLLIVEPEKDEPLSKRIARNVSTILKEESYLAKVADPVAGSYYIEKLTDDLSKKAWTLFQNQFENQTIETHA